MQTMNHSLGELVRRNLITVDMALSHTSDQDDLKRILGRA